MLQDARAAADGAADGLSKKRSTFFSVLNVHSLSFLQLLMQDTRACERFPAKIETSGYKLKDLKCATRKLKDVTQ